MSNITERRPETQPPAAPPSRRRLIAIVLLCIALGGALLRYVAAPGSTARDIGTLMLLLWLPIIGNVVAWIFAKVRRATARAPGVPAAVAETAHPFAPQRVVELTLRPSSLPAENTPIPAGEHRCALVVDKEGFSARWIVAAGDSFKRGEMREVDIEFMVPALALHRMQPGTTFRMLVGESFVGDGRVLRAA